MPIICFPVCEEIPCVRGISGKALQQARLRLAKHNVNFGLALSTLAEHTSALVPLVGCAPSESSRAQWGAPADELAAMIDTGALEGRGGGIVYYAHCIPLDPMEPFEFEESRESI